MYSKDNQAYKEQVRQKQNAHFEAQNVELGLFFFEISPRSFRQISAGQQEPIKLSEIT
jgi:hypothetical protein